MSRIREELDVRVDASRNRALGHVAFLHVHLDAMCINVATTPWAKSCPEPS